MCADIESVTFQLSRQYFFTFLGSAHVKASRKTLMKLTPGVDIFLHAGEIKKVFITLSLISFLSFFDSF